MGLQLERIDSRSILYSALNGVGAVLVILSLLVEFNLSAFVIMENVIKFYSVRDEYGEFSNFAAYSIKLKGKTWPTTEHYFQAMKFDSEKD